MPRYEATGSTEGLLAPDDDDLARTRVTGMPRIPEPAAPPKVTQLGLGPVHPVPIPAAGQPLPSFGSGAPEMLDYGADDEEAVTTVLAPPSEAEDPPTISTVHEPAKKQFPAAMPDDKIVVAPTLLMPPEEPRTALGGNFAPTQPPMHAANAQIAAQQPTQPGLAGGLPKDARSVLIALIAAATTLIALALTALVILKLVEKPSEPETAPTTVAAKPITPTPPPTPKVVGEQPPPKNTVEPYQAPTSTATVKPEELPKEAPKTAGKTAAPPSTTKSVPGPAPAPTEKKEKEPAAKTGGEPGFLTVVCDPFCDGVSAGGRNLGPSPVVRAALPPGNHGVTLRRSGSPTKSISVTIVSGQTTARRVKM